MRYTMRNWVLWVAGALLFGYAQAVDAGVIVWAAAILCLVAGFVVRAGNRA